MRAGLPASGRERLPRWSRKKVAGGTAIPLHHLFKPHCLLLLACLAGSLTHASYAAGTEPVAAAASRQNNLGVALMNQQLTEKALGAFDAAQKQDPASALIVLNKGIAELYLQRLPEAQTTMQTAVKMAPGSAEAWYVYGLLERMAGDPQAAVGDFKKVVTFSPQDADAHYFLGTTYFETQQYPEALAEFQDALKLNPIHASALFGMARVLQRMGKAGEAQAELKRFTEVRDSKVSSPMTANYGEQGHFAMVRNFLLPEPTVGPMIPVHLTAAAAMGDTPSDSGTGGICMLGQDLVTLGSGAHALHIYGDTGGKFQELPAASTGLDISGHAVSCAVGDYDNDGQPDLAVAMQDRVVLFRNLGNGRFEDATAKAGLKPLNHPAGLTFIDFDHDGDLDLFMTGSAAAPSGTPNVLWRNDGNGSFTEWTSEAALGGTGSTQDALLSDVNNDRAVDLVVTGSGAAPTVYLNPREGHFKAMPLYATGGLAASSGVAALDFDKDDWMDFAVTHDGAPGLTLWRNVDGTHFDRVPLPTDGVLRAWGVTPIDIDNDGWIDLAAVVETTHGTALRVYRNLGPKGWEDVSAQLGLDTLKLDGARSVIAADVNGDGAADLILSREHAPPMVLLNEGGSRNHSLRIELAGLADNRSAIGTKVEVLVNGHQQKFEVAGSSGYRSQGSLEIIAGLGQATQADVVRMLWPTGVPQDEIDRPADTTLALKELDRRGSSCPVLFAWNGKRYQFVSDVIGAGVVGHWTSPTSTNQEDADEWIKVDADQLKPANGYLSLRFGEPMEEINFIDRLRLVAVDHPAGTVVFPDEKFLSERPFATGATVVASHPHPVAGAWDNQGREVSATLRTVDHHYVRNFTNLQFAGFADPHTLTLDLGTWNAQKPLRLLMRGYVEYFSASSMYSAWQAGLKPEPPAVDAQLPDGTWKRVINDMGFPAGLPRTIVVDLTGKLPPGTRRIRIRTNLQLYWDQVLVDNSLPVVVHQTELPLGMAHLAFRGYPKQVEGKTPGDLTYDYQQISATGPFDWQRGDYTHYGNVTPLLTHTDDQYAIFGSGEEIDAEFAARVLPPLPAHWTRDYFFYADGYVKDMDFHEAMPFTVGEMPYRGMPKYPYPRTNHYPDTAATVNYRLNWDDRFESGTRIQPWRFDYKPVASRPMTQP